MNGSEIRLSSGERLLWSGAPRQGVVFRSADGLLIPLSLMWGGFAFFWEAMVLCSDGPAFMKLWGVPFVLVGLYLIVGRFFHDAWSRSRTTYGVTNERIVIVNGVNEKSLPLKTLAEVTLTTRSDGSGTIQFGSLPFGAWSGMGFSWPGMPRVPVFESIPDAHTVHDLIRRAQKEII
jgi:hypothetical protein